jgi:hypothetical protein
VTVEPRVAARPAVPAQRHELVEVCARHADALAGQVESAERVIATQLRLLRRGQVRRASVSAEWVRSTLRVVADSLGELHTALDELGGRDLSGAE